MKGEAPLEQPPWERLLYLDRVQEHAPELVEEIVDSLVERFGARRGALVLTGREGAPTVVAARERDGSPADPASIHPPESALDSLATRDGAVLTLRAGKAAAIPLKAVVRDGNHLEQASRRRYDFPRIERTLGYVYLEGDRLELGTSASEVRVASTLGSLLLASSLQPTLNESEEMAGLRSPLLLRETLAEEMTLAKETETPLTLALAEVDLFPAWLVSHGPAEGKRLLSALSGGLRRELRRFDAVLRSGGHSFALLLPATDPGGAQVVTEKVRSAAQSAMDGVTMSLGCASFPADAATPDQLIYRAEQALEQAREKGGDRGISWSPSLRSTRVFAGHAVSVAGPGDLDRVLHAIDGLDQIGASHTMAAAVDALVRGAVLASGAARGAFFQPGERGMRRVAALGEGGSPPSQLLRRAVASAGRVQGNEDDAGLPRTVVWGVPGRAGTVGVLVLERDAESFGAAALRSAEAMVRLATPILRERMVSDEVAEEADWSPFPGLVGNSPAMQEVYGLMRKVLTSRVTVLVIGETGTGKELIARAIHMHSDRADGSFVTVDCGALPPTLADSELFGHRKGAFTDATTDREGLIERAEGGTVLLDEVSSMGADLQPKLLRFLQEGEVRRVGETEYRQVDVRVLAASNHDPREDVDAGRLRLDLYHRLSGMEIRVPPLRERKEDIPALASHFLRAFAHEEGKPAKRLGADALERLISHDWPGNVRELENAIRAGGLVAEGETICASDLPEPLQDAGVARQWPIPRTNHEFRQAKEDAVAEITRQFLKGALVEAAGNVSEAARRTGLQRTYFHRLMKEFGVNAGDFK